MSALFGQWACAERRANHGYQSHLGATFHYCLGQQSHHLARVDPLFDATNLPDLLGLRLVGRYTMANMYTVLPRIGRERLLRHFGVIDLDRGRMHLDDLADAAAGAFGLGHLR